MAHCEAHIFANTNPILGRNTLIDLWVHFLTIYAKI